MPSSQRIAGYEGYPVRIKRGGQYVAGFGRASVVKDPNELINYRAGGNPGANPRIAPPRKYQVVSLESGVAYDPGFALWIKQVNGPRLHLTAEFYNSQGKLVGVRTLPNSRVWPVLSSFRPVHWTGPNLGASGGAVAIEHIKIEIEGFMIDPPTGSGSPPEYGTSK